MINSVSKPKLPKGLAYVLKTPQLEHSLDEAGIEIHVDLKYWRPQRIGSILEGHYWVPNANVPYSRVYVRAGCVQSEHRSTACDGLLKTALPGFMNWLTRIVALPEGSPQLATELYFNAVFSDGKITISNTPLRKRRR